MTSNRGSLFPKVPFISQVEKWPIGAVYFPGGRLFPGGPFISHGAIYFPKPKNPGAAHTIHSAQNPVPKIPSSQKPVAQNLVMKKIRKSMNFYVFAKLHKSIWIYFVSIQTTWFFNRNASIEKSKALVPLIA